MAGGLDEPGPRRRIACSSTTRSQTSWSEGPALPEPVHHAALVSDGDALFLIGGYPGDGFGRPTAAVWRLEDTSRAVDRRPDRCLSREGAGAAAWNGQGRIVYGGGVGPAGVSADVFVRGRRRLASAGVAEPAARAPCRSRPRRRVRHVPGRPRRGKATRDGRSRVRGGRRRPHRGPADGARRDRGILGRRRWAIASSAARARTGRSAPSSASAPSPRRPLPGLTVPRHGLGGVFLDGRAYVAAGRPAARPDGQRRGRGARPPLTRQDGRGAGPPDRSARCARSACCRWPTRSTTPTRCCCRRSSSRSSMSSGSRSRPWRSSPRSASFASGMVQLSYAELTRRVSRRRLLGLGGLVFGGGFAAHGARRRTS